MRLFKRLLLGLAVVLIGAFLLLRTPDTDPFAMRAKYGGAPSQFLTLANGLTVHVRDEGPRGAPVIMLLHGSNSDLHTWDAWTALLSPRYRVIRLDQIGHGLTGPSPGGDYSPAAFDAVIAGTAAQLGISKFALAGNSMGGGIALHYALAHADQVTALVLIDAGGAPRLGNQPGNIGFAIARIPVLRNLMLSITPRSLVDKSLHQSVFNQAVATPAAIDRYWELLRYPGNRQATLDRFARGFQSFSPQQLAALKLPVLVLWGAHDRLIGVQSARWFEQHIAGSALIVYPAAGHLPMEEVAQQSAADTATWLAAHGISGAPG